MACPTKSLSEYVTFVIGLIVATKMLTGQLPNISPQTGDPEYQGESKAMLDAYRAKANVRTFDDATAQCRQLNGGRRAMVLNYPDDGMSMWVGERSGAKYWITKSAADPAPQK